ncbi:hypothetical protein GCM10010232_70980 [Streptomyces amakusaensis]|uniref:DUF6221 family protein n=1 Tax=Streptomyces amakusaensis TaxID=67271 RepID=A0ABW0AU33_9ACTN
MSGTVWDWCEFLWARINEEKHAAEGAGQAPDGTSRPWELTEPGAARIGVRAGEHVLATVSTGHGLWADHIVAAHVVRTQPRQAMADLDALANLVDLLAHCDNHKLTITSEVLDVVNKFAERWRKHPDHPERRQP